MVSPEIESLRDDYLALMHRHGTMAHADIVASVRETQAQLLEIFRSVPESTAEIKPAPDEWCLRELAIHAAFTERLVAKLVHLTARSDTPTAADLHRAGIGMMPEDDGATYAQAVDDLDAMNAELIRAIESLPDSPDKELRLPHPFFGPLNCLEWAGFQRVHDLDHIQHARRIIAAVSD